jgi:hypothetical protein
MCVRVYTNIHACMNSYIHAYISIHTHTHTHRAVAGYWRPTSTNYTKLHKIALTKLIYTHRAVAGYRRRGSDCNAVGHGRVRVCA